MKPTRITIEATIDAPVKKAWTYWIEPDHITNWNFASDDWCCPRAENDLKVGGKYSTRMEAKDGSAGFDFEAIYDEICEHKKIVFTMTDGRVVTTVFEKQNGSTKVITTFDAEEQNSIEMQRGGWQAILDNFKKHVETN